MKYLRVCLVIMLLLAIVFILFHACSRMIIDLLFEDIGSRDWHISLSNGYEIVKVNSGRIILIHESDATSTEVIISDYINAYQLNESYLLIYCANNGSSTLMGIDSEKDRYYLVDLQKNILNGPFTKSEFEEYCSDQSVPLSETWTRTIPRPDAATFD